MRMTFCSKSWNLFQKTLEFFELYGLQSDRNLVPGTYLRFSLTEKFQNVSVYCAKCELGSGNVSDLQTSFPEMTSVHLLKQTEDRLATWTNNSKFEKVEMLCVSLANEELEEEDDGYFISPGFSTMTQLQETFPNISYLLLTVNIGDLTTEKYVFENMVQLRSLNLTFFGNMRVLDNSIDLIDS